MLLLGLNCRSLLKAKANRTFFATSHTLQQITMRSILTKNMMYFCELANLKPNMNPFSKIRKFVIKSRETALNFCINNYFFKL